MLQNTFEIFQQTKNTANDDIVRNTAEHFYKVWQYSTDGCASNEKIRIFFSNLITEFWALFKISAPS